MKPLYKILLIAGVALLIILGVYFGWRALVAPSEKTPLGEGGNLPTSEEKSPTGGKETGINEESKAGEKQLAFKKFSENPVFDILAISESKEIYYATPEGKVFIAKEGPDLAVSNQTLAALNFVVPEPTNQKALAAFGDPQSPNWAIFDVAEKTWRPLPADITNAAWGMKNTELFAVAKSGNAFNLVKVDLAKNPLSYQILLSDFRIKDIVLNYLDDGKLLIVEKPSAAYNGTAWQLDLANQTLNKLTAGSRGFMLQPSRNREYFFEFNSPKQFLISDKSLGNFSQMFFSTLPSKCVSSGNVIYCFAPQALEEKWSLPDDYLKSKFHSIDSLYKFDITTNGISKILSSGDVLYPAIDAKNPIYLEGILYFINRYDNALYKLELP